MKSTMALCGKLFSCHCLPKVNTEHISHWETAIPDALHSVRSLLSTATNWTPHERMFTYNRKSSNGPSVPSWLNKSQTVLLKRRVRQSKRDPLVDEVKLLDVTPC